MNREQLRPSFEHMDAICALEGRRVDRERFADVLEQIFDDQPSSRLAAQVRALIPPEATRRPRRSLLYRHRPYLVPGSRTLLRNSLGIYDAKELSAFEDVLVACAGTRLLSADEIPQLDACGIHTLLFAEVYPWAWLTRIVELSKAGTSFVPSGQVCARLSSLRSPCAAVTGPRDTETVARELARWYADFNAIHPFREGNGRTGAMCVTLAARSVGMDLDFSRVRHRQWYEAARLSLVEGPKGNVDPEPVADILSSIITRRHDAQR